MKYLVRQKGTAPYTTDNFDFKYDFESGIRLKTLTLFEVNAVNMLIIICTFQKLVVYL